eukprot:15430513-Alexandrium_andersonii.AAC.1
MHRQALPCEAVHERQRRAGAGGDGVHHVQPDAGLVEDHAHRLPRARADHVPHRHERPSTQVAQRR